MTQNIPSQSQFKALASKTVLMISQLLEYWEETGKTEMGKGEKIRKFLSENNE